MALGKQAKTLNNNQQKTVLNYLKTTRSPVRNKVIFLLSLKAGLRAKEISQLTWRMVTTSDSEIADCISLTNKASKGTSGGVVWLNKELFTAITELWGTTWQSNKDTFVIQSERQNHMSAQAIVNMFSNWYKQMGFIRFTPTRLAPGRNRQLMVLTRPLTTRKPTEPVMLMVRLRTYMPISGS